MIKKAFIGIDTSNYTTSFAVLDENGNILHNFKILLPVANGERGLRQSDAVFSHIKNFQLISEEIKNKCENYDILSIGYSAYPRDAEGSYMPCFLVGEMLAKFLSSLNKCNVYKFSHQSGHIKSAIYSSGADIENEFISFHVSGGTTEILRVNNVGGKYLIDVIGKSIDLHAGQAIDRIGVLMGLKFPCGKEMEMLAKKNINKIPSPKICVKGFECNLSGLENLASKLYKETNDKSLVSAYVIEFIYKTILKITQNLREQIPHMHIIYAGGVMSNSIIKEKICANFENVYFAAPEFSSDNACGVALLAREMYLKDKE